MSVVGYLVPWAHRGLIGQFAARDVQARYRQSWLGLAWLVLAPLLMLVVYTLVFQDLMQVKWAGRDEGGLAFALRIYCGLAVFNFFADCALRAPALVIERPNLVKKVVFPLEVLAWSNVVSAAVGLLVSLPILVVLAWAVQGHLAPSVLALPFVLLPLLPLGLGLGWLLGGLGPYVRDISQILGLAVGALMFLSPVFFPIEAVPARARAWLQANPLTTVISQVRDCLMAGQWPPLVPWLGLTAGTVAFAWLAALFFRRVRGGFADVI